MAQTTWLGYREVLDQLDVPDSYFQAIIDSGCVDNSDFFWDRPYQIQRFYREPWFSILFEAIHLKTLASLEWTLACDGKAPAPWCGDPSSERALQAIYTGAVRRYNGDVNVWDFGAGYGVMATQDYYQKRVQLWADQIAARISSPPGESGLPDALDYCATKILPWGFYNTCLRQGDEITPYLLECSMTSAADPTLTAHWRHCDTACVRAPDYSHDHCEGEHPAELYGSAAKLCSDAEAQRGERGDVCMPGQGPWIARCLAPLPFWDECASPCETSATRDHCAAQP
jgi:hypothetical protein